MGLTSSLDLDPMDSFPYSVLEKRFFIKSQLFGAIKVILIRKWVRIRCDDLQLIFEQFIERPRFSAKVKKKPFEKALFL